MVCLITTTTTASNTATTVCQLLTIWLVFINQVHSYNDHSIHNSHNNNNNNNNNRSSFSDDKSDSSDNDAASTHSHHPNPQLPFQLLDATILPATAEASAELNNDTVINYTVVIDNMEQQESIEEAATTTTTSTVVVMPISNYVTERMAKSDNSLPPNHILKTQYQEVIINPESSIRNITSADDDEAEQEEDRDAETVPSANDDDDDDVFGNGLFIENANSQEFNEALGNNSNSSHPSPTASIESFNTEATPMASDTSGGDLTTTTTTSTINTASAFAPSSSSSSSFPTGTVVQPKLKHKSKHIKRFRAPAHDLLRIFLEDSYLRSPLAILVDTAPQTLAKTKILWNATLKPTTPIDMILISFDSTGIFASYNFKSTRSLVAGLNSIQSNLEAVDQATSTWPPSTARFQSDKTFATILKASELVPYDSAIFMFTASEPIEDDMAQIAALQLLKKRIRLYLFWFGNDDNTDHEHDPQHDHRQDVIDGTTERPTSLLDEVAIRSGGEIIVMTNDVINMNGDVGLVTLQLHNNIQGLHQFRLDSNNLGIGNGPRASDESSIEHDEPQPQSQIYYGHPEYVVEAPGDSVTNAQHHHDTTNDNDSLAHTIGG